MDLDGGTLGDRIRLVLKRSEAAEETALRPWGRLFVTSHNQELPTRVGEFTLEAGLDISAGSREAHPRQWLAHAFQADGG